MPYRGVKIFVEAHCFDREYQGSRTFLKGLYTALMQSEGCPEIYFGARDTDHLKREFPGLADDRFIRYETGSAALRLGIEIPRIIRRYGFDHAHFQYVIPPVKGCRFLVTVHDVLFNDFKQLFPPPYRFVRNRFFKYSVRTAEIRTAPSGYARERIAFHYRVDPEEIAIIPNGVSPAFFQASVSREKAAELLLQRYGIENFILCVSRIEPRKNHLLLLKTFLDLRLYEQGITLVFAGNASLNHPGLTAALRSLPAGAGRYFRLLPQVPQDDLLLFYQTCRLMVYPSFAEGFGIPPLEAGVMGAPVLCSNTTAMAGYHFFGDALFNPADEAEFRQKLQFRLFHPPGKEELDGIAACILRNYSWQNSAEKFLQLLG